MKYNPFTLASAEMEMLVGSGRPLGVSGPMLSCTESATRSTWGRWDSFRNRAGLYAESSPMAGLITPSRTKRLGTCELATRSEKEDSVLRAAATAPMESPPSAPTSRITEM